MKAVAIAFAVVSVLARPALGQIASNDEQIAHNVVTANQADNMTDKPRNIVTTPTEPEQFGRDSVYATQPRNPGNPVLAGGLTVDEAGGAPLYAVQLTHPSGPVMEGGKDLQPYGRDSVYVAAPRNAAPLSHLVGRQQFHN